MCPDVGEREVGGGPGQVLEGQVAEDDVEWHVVDESGAVDFDGIEGLRVDVVVFRWT